MNDKLKAGLILFFLALLLIFNQPILGIFSGRLLGLPGPFLFFGFVWCIIIGGLVWFSTKMKGDKES